MESLLKDFNSSDANEGGIPKKLLEDNLGVDYVLLFNYGAAESKVVFKMIC